MKAQTDERVLRRALTQLLTADLSKEHGWREGVSFHTGLPKMQPDMVAGETLVQRGVMSRSALGSLVLSESAVVRVLHIAVDAAVADLLASDPPRSSFGDELSEDEDNSYLILCGVDCDEHGVRSW